MLEGYQTRDYLSNLGLTVVAVLKTGGKEDMPS
jgi:hypothetical protein